MKSLRKAMGSGDNQPLSTKALAVRAVLSETVTPQQAAVCYNASTRTINSWVTNFNRSGLAGLGADVAATRHKSYARAERALDKAIGGRRYHSIPVRASAVNAILQNTISIKDASFCYNASGQTIRNWISRFQQSGSDGLQNKPKSGRPSTVDRAVLIRYAKRLEKAKKLNPANLRDTLLSHGYNLSISHLRRLLRMLRNEGKLPQNNERRGRPRRKN